MIARPGNDRKVGRAGRRPCHEETDLAWRLNGRRSALLMTGLAVVLSMTTWFSATAVTSELTALMAISPSRASWLTNAVQLGFVCGALLSGLLSLADVLRLNTVMAAACMAAACFNAVAVLEPGFAAVVASRAATGFSLALVYPPSLKFMSTWYRDGRGFAMGAMLGALTLGSAVPHLFRGLTDSVPWQGIILACSFASLIAAAIFLFVLHEGPHAFGRARVDPRQLCAVVRNHPLMLANAGYFGHCWELYAMWGWILTYTAAARDSGVAIANASFLAFAVIALGAPGCIVAGGLADRIGRCRTTALMMALSGVSSLAIGLFFTGPDWALVLVALIWGATIVSDSAQFSAAVSELADQTLVGTALAFQMGIGFAITMVSIWLVPVFADLIGGWRWSFLILAPGPLLGMLAMLRLRRMPASALLANGNR